GVGAAAGHRANHGDVRGHVEPEPAVRGRHGAGQQALAPEGPPALDRVGARDVVLARPRGDRLTGHTLRALENSFVHELTSDGGDPAPRRPAARTAVIRSPRPATIPLGPAPG